MVTGLWEIVNAGADSGSPSHPPCPQEPEGVEEIWKRRGPVLKPRILPGRNFITCQLELPSLAASGGMRQSGQEAGLVLKVPIQTKPVLFCRRPEMLGSSGPSP